MTTTNTIRWVEVFSADYDYQHDTADRSFVIPANDENQKFNPVDKSNVCRANNNYSHFAPLVSFQPRPFLFSRTENRLSQAMKVAIHLGRK
jgi:hypothetical protein